jgi:outer membrane protein assembly factor BamB
MRLTLLVAVVLIARPADAQRPPPSWQRGPATAGPLPPIAIEPHRARRTVPLAGVLDGPVAVDELGAATFLTEEGVLGRVAPDGSLRWSLLVGPPGGEPAVGPDGTIYAAGRDGWLYAVGADGALRWMNALGGRPVRGLAVGPTRLAVALDDGRLELWKPDGGTIGWIALGGTPSAAAVLIGADRALVPTREGRVISIAGRRIAWRATVVARAAVGPLAIGDGGAVYAGTADGTVACILADGTVAWRARVGAPVTRSPALAEDGAVIVAAGDSVVALGRSGAVRWRSPVGAPIVSGPLLAASGSIYVGSQAGEIRVLDAGGHELRRIALPAAPSRGLALHAETLWVGLRDRTLLRVAVPERGLARSSWAKARGNRDNSGAL